MTGEGDVLAELTEGGSVCGRVPAADSDQNIACLSRVADAVVAGAVLKDFEIADLRALIEAVQNHPRAVLAPLGATEQPQENGSRPDITRLVIQGGRILRADCGARATGTNEQPLTVRIEIVAASHFCFDASFRKVRFVGPVRFDKARFSGRVRFDNTVFLENVWFLETEFEKEGRFDTASFAKWARFDEAVFFERAWFDAITVAGLATFRQARFGADARFARAIFGDQALFSGASFASSASFEQTVFVGPVRFDLARFAGTVVGDLRTATVRQAIATIRKQRLALIRCYARTFISWSTVRALGRLDILNRVSLIALILVPLMAAAFLPLREALARFKAADGSITEVAPLWLRLIVHVLGNDPHLGFSISLTFVAAVCVTMGLLLYQIFVPEAVRKRDEEEHVRDLEARYPEGQPQRNDGLRRALEQFDELARKHPHRHPGFVLHHGELIWLPTRERIEWFDDRNLPRPDVLVLAARRAHARAIELNLTGAAGESEASAGAIQGVMEADAREGFMPGAERARICIEEGARAEYWLKARHNLIWAWLSLISYAAGMACLLWIMVRQVCLIVKAAGWY